MSAQGFQPRPDVTLRPLAEEHAPAMLRWVLTREIAENIGLRQTPTLEKTLAFVARTKCDPELKAFAVYLGDGHVGNVVLDRIDNWLNSARLSVYVGEASARGCGVGAAAVYRAAENGFNTLGLNKIWLTVRADNARAIEAYQRVGFQTEGMLRAEFRVGEKLEPAIYMGLLRDDFLRARENA